jgi:hypothetical protein
MPYDPSSNHVKINVNKTLNQMLVGFYRRRMVTIFPVGPFMSLPQIATANTGAGLGQTSEETLSYDTDA